MRILGTKDRIIALIGWCQSGGNGAMVVWLRYYVTRESTSDRLIDTDEMKADEDEAGDTTYPDHPL